MTKHPQLLILRLYTDLWGVATEQQRERRGESLTENEMEPK